VLRKFTKDEQPIIKEAVSGAADAVECILAEGVASAMTRVNVKKA
jgi:peptidyl-tRNA hydrolase